MATDRKLPLLTSTNNTNLPKNPASKHQKGGRQIEEMYQKKTQPEHILLRPDTYVGSIEKTTQNLWVFEGNEMVYRPVSYVPGLYKIFDEILVNAADNKQRDPKMALVKVDIDVLENTISVFNDGDGVPVEIHQEEGIYVPEMIFGHLLTSSNYDDAEKKTAGGRNGYGAKLANIFSIEFTVETADGKRKKQYKQVFSNNMRTKSKPIITECKASENWTKVTFKPDLGKFNMTHLETDVVALMMKRVMDIAGCLGKTLKVELNGHEIPIKSFGDYIDLYIKSAAKNKPEAPPKLTEKVNDRWEICISLSEGQFQQVSFVNGIATINGGTHVDYVADLVSSHIMNLVNKKNKNANLKAHTVKNHLWIFVNALIDNPAFDSQTKETLTTPPSSFVMKCDLSQDLLKRVAKSGIVESFISRADFKANKNLKNTGGSKKERILGIHKLEDANEAGKKASSHNCTSILTEGDSAKALAMADLHRSIPAMVDGLKLGQRKILFCSFKRNNFRKEVKVAQFSGYVTEHSAYHYGEASLAGTIIGMAQDFVGSNNINLLQPNGQFGTRHQGGKDHGSAKYVYTCLSPITRFLFPEEDDILLDYLNEDGQSIEPTWYAPIIPTVLVNGSQGIGTGWTTFIPNYNPRDIVANVKRLINGEPMVPMDPWYRGFKGTIEKTASKEGWYTVTGVIEEVNATTLRVSELPVQRWTQDYKEFLESMMTENDEGKEPFIKDYREQNDDTTVHFEVVLSEENMMIAKQEGILKKFKLSNSLSTNNMHIFGPEGVIKKYDNPEQIIEDFFGIRLELYKKRKRVLLENLEYDLNQLDNEVRFILGVMKGEIIVSNRKRVDVYLELQKKGFDLLPPKAKNGVSTSKPEDAEENENEDNSDLPGDEGVLARGYAYLLTLAMGSLTFEKVQELREEKEKLEGEVEELKNATEKSLWLKDLETFEKKLNEQDSKTEDREVMIDAGTNAGKHAPKDPKKYAEEAASTAVPAAAPATSSMEIDDITEVVPKLEGKGGPKKDPAKKFRQKKKKKSRESIMSTDQCRTHPKHGQTKKSPLGTMTTDQGQVYPEQQESATIIEKEDNTEQLELTSTTVVGGTNRFSSLYVLEQQESTTIIEKTDHPDESPISSTQPTGEGQVPEKSSGGLLDFIRVPKLSEYGTVEYIVIPTRSYWLEIIREDWGATDEEIIACIKAAPQLSRFKIEVCGSSMGHGVIVRSNSKRNPIVVKCTVVADRVSPFYHELLGVSLGMKLAMKYKIIYFNLHCVSGVVAEYVMRTWDIKNDCGCPPIDNPEHSKEKKDYCVKCSESMLDAIGESQNADKISAVVDEIFYDAFEFGEEGFLDFYLYPIELSRAKAVCHLAKSGVDRELRIHEIEKDEELAEILYKEVFGHGSEEEVGLQKQQLMLRKRERKLQKQRNLAAEGAYQESLWGQ